MSLATYGSDMSTALDAAPVGSLLREWRSRRRVSQLELSIQAAISTIDYDFWGWALERWGRASAAFARDDFDDLLADTIAG